MDTSFTDCPTWIMKIKTRFVLLDVDKNGVVDTQDVAMIARNLASYRNQGSDEENHYFKVIKASSLVDEKGATEEEFIERAKQFVSQPDAKEHVKELVDAIFKVMDANKDGVVSYEEFLQFHKAFNIDQETIDMVFKDTDTNGDGVIDQTENYESFVNFFFSA